MANARIARAHYPYYYYYYYHPPSMYLVINEKSNDRPRN